MKTIRFASIAFTFAALAACSASSPGEQTIKGQTALSTFPAALTEVQALRGATVVSHAPVASDGTFSLSLAPGNGYQIQFLRADGQVAMVFPRSAGSVDSRFDIRAVEKPFNLGKVRYIGDPATQTYAFNTVGSTSSALTSSNADTDDVQCEDGIDPTTGAVCVDDEDDEGAGACEEDGDADNVNCEDGIDPATGLECDGGPTANADDGTEDSAEDDGATPSEAAVPDHNLPAAMGCAADDDNDNVECEDGIDPATGLECDGGPAANTDDGE